MTPRFFWSAESWANAFRAPRSLKLPVRCAFSNLQKTSAPLISLSGIEWRQSEQKTAPAMRSRAASISLKVVTHRECQREIAPRQDWRCGLLGDEVPNLFCVQRFANFGRQLLAVEWLRQEKHTGLTTIARLERLFEISRDEENSDVWVGGAKCVGKTASTDLGHHHVGEKQIDFTSPVLC